LLNETSTSILISLKDMDFLDTKKEFRERVILLIGYVLIAIAITLSTLILVYQSFGFKIGHSGTVVQDGLIFLSSQPSPANIYIDGKIQSQTTNSRLFLADGVYSVRLNRSGYRIWKRTIAVQGGSVEHYDYPFLIPNKLVTKKIYSYAAAPGLVTQSPDQKWLMVENPGSMTSFDLYDLKNSAKPVETIFTIPAGILSKSDSTNESLQLVSWSDDNQHVLLEHLYDGKSEYILLDRTDPSQSVNLNNTLNIMPTSLTLDSAKYNQYYSYDATTQDLNMFNLNSPTPTLVQDHVLAYKSYGNNTILYTTSDNAPKNMATVRLKEGDNNYTIRNIPASSTYLLNLTTYSGVLYVAAGSSSDSNVYIYHDPASEIANNPDLPPVPLWDIHVSDPNYLSFSNNTQFIVAENGVHYGVYDFQNKIGYTYSDEQLPVDSPQLHASWMDGDRLTYVSNGKLMIQDYDNNNQQQLVSADSSYLPVFSDDYKYVYNFTADQSGQIELDQTALQIPADL
jgi:hypothetical protein